MGRPYLTQEDFLTRLSGLGKKYKLKDPLQIYTGAKSKYNIICPKHPQNNWVVLGSSLLSGATCPLCSNEQQSLDKVLSPTEVAQRFKKDGRGFKIRTGFEYIDGKTEIPIQCPQHPEYMWVTRPLDVIRDQKWCPMCRGKAPLCNATIDDRLNNRDIQRMSEYSGKANSLMKFKCLKDGYEWEAKVSRVASPNTVYQQGCPRCAGLEPWTNKRVDDWLRINNPLITRVSNIKSSSLHTQFRCLVDGYEWGAEFRNVRQGYGCPCCRDRKYWSPELVERWLLENKPHLSLQDTFTLATTNSTFLCSKHNLTFEKRFSSLRTSDCPQCAGGGGYKQHLEGYLYYARLSVNKNTFYKIGITNRKPLDRVKETKHDFEILKTYRFVDGSTARKIEQEVLLTNQKYVQKEYVFSGSTECFTRDIREFCDLQKLVDKHT